MEYDANINVTASPAPVPFNTQRLKSKLRLPTMKYTDADAIKLFDSQPDIKSILSLTHKVKA